MVISEQIFSNCALLRQHWPPNVEGQSHKPNNSSFTHMQMWFVITQKGNAQIRNISLCLILFLSVLSVVEIPQWSGCSQEMCSDFLNVSHFLYLGTQLVHEALVWQVDIMAQCVCVQQVGITELDPLSIVLGCSRLEQFEVEVEKRMLTNFCPGRQTRIVCHLHTGHRDCSSSAGGAAGAGNMQYCRTVIEYFYMLQSWTRFIFTQSYHWLHHVLIGLFIIF